MVPTYDPVIYDGFANALAEDDEVYDGAAASVPFSFHYRSLQSQHMSNELDAWLDESFSEASLSQRIDSAMGSVDGLSELADPVFAADEKGHDGGDDTRSLQYHRIQMKSRAELKEIVTPSPLSPETTLIEYANPPSFLKSTAYLFPATTTAHYPATSAPRNNTPAHGPIEI